MKKIIILLICLLSVACTKTTLKSSPTSLEDLMANNEYIIVDVRTKEEYTSSHIKNAINIPYDTIDSTTNLNKEKLIFVYCKSGKRSKIAYDTLKEMGYNVYDLGAFDSINLEKE